jgi:UDPglucose 6-dehydrogenase
LRVCDPQGQHEGEALLPGVKWCDTAYNAVNGADAVVLLTEWNEFRALDLGKLARKMQAPRMADLRNVYTHPEALAAGFEAYVSIGRDKL